MKCAYCKDDFEKKNSNHKYCSNSCKQKAYQQRKANDTLSGGLPSGFPAGLSDSIVSLPQMKGTEIIASKAMNGVGDVVTNTIKGQQKNLQPPSAPRQLTSKRRRAGASLLVTAIGGFIGYKLTDDKASKLQGATLGAIAGGFVYSVVELIFDPFNLWTEEEAVNDGLGTLSDGIYKDGQVYSARQYSTLPTHTVKWKGKWGDYFDRFGFNDIIMIYGGQGSGKSHLATQLAGELGVKHDVLYVTAEEGVANHVQERFERYGLNNKNVSILPTRKPKEVINTVREGNYSFVIIDSLQGLNLAYSSQSAFLEEVTKNQTVHSLIFLNQMNKNNEFRGMQELGHLTSAEIKVENGKAITIKNRQNDDKPTENVFNDDEEVKVIPHNYRKSGNF